MSLICNTPKPPYYAVIFTSVRSSIEDGYADMANHMMKLAAQQPGFLGVESARESIGITVSYWESLQAIKDWKNNQNHMQAQQLGKEKWYSEYTTRIVRVEKEYSFNDEGRP
ncbi:antibiotic biosynthesis monooxygenase [Parashewanella curva]|uniref:Antibiotic biosynthesis monooxygenase n=1 Tax=Parashewanella curva TaxID=2338552 RepID=A0A3L8Q3J0_9GAMM|nr:antibiotic biosynthesis monooxygenase [Parashewanella curva]RLV61272.1 antibiotic biosynthesis monooxygenase [Parashewanella curva]